MRKAGFPENRGLDRSAGFTLIELIVVVAVTAILAAIVFSVFASSREEARKTVCSSNLKQIGAAVMLYVEDHDGRLFPSQQYRSRAGLVTWSGLALASPPHEIVPAGGELGPYVRDDAVWYCPAASRAETNPGHPYRTPGFPPYGLNDSFYWIEVSQGTPAALSQVGRPSETILMADSARYSGGRLRWTDLLMRPSEGQNTVRGRHDGFANVLWCDGHVTAQKPAAVPPAPGVSAAPGSFHLGDILPGRFMGNAATDDYFYTILKQ